jgi:hypothetical protein
MQLINDNWQFIFMRCELLFLIFMAEQKKLHEK